MTTGLGRNASGDDAGQAHLLEITNQRLSGVGPFDKAAVVEAMKMENPVLAAVGGVVEQVMCVCGQQVANQQVLVVIKEESS